MNLEKMQHKYAYTLARVGLNVQPGQTVLVEAAIEGAYFTPIFAEECYKLGAGNVVIHYLGKRYIIELKIWRGARYNEDGEKQVISYLDFFGLDVGYMVSFSFNKNKEPGVHDVRFGDKLLIEGIV